MDIKFKKDAKGNITSVVLNDVTFYYTNIRNPKPVYDDRKLSYEKARKEYTVDVVVNEDIADAWDEVFAKQPSKKLLNAKFKEKYKLEDDDEVPLPKEKKQFTLKVVQKAEKKDGDPISEKLLPRVFIKQDGKPVDITFSTNVGNGSKGSLLIRANTNDYGSFAYLSKMLVDDLVEYEDGGALSEDDEEFLGTDDVEFAEAPERKGAKPTDDEANDDDVPEFSDGEEEDEDY